MMVRWVYFVTMEEMMEVVSMIVLNLEQKLYEFL